MAKKKICERCHASFECSAENIIQCACSNIKLSETEKEMIKFEYKDCLCVKCLQEIKTGTLHLNENRT